MRRDRAAVSAVQHAPRVRHRAVRALKARWLRRAHECFLHDEVGPQSPRFARFDTFTLRRGVVARRLRPVPRAPRRPTNQRPGGTGPSPSPGASRRRWRAHGRSSRSKSATAYVQWIAAEQWERARHAAAPLQIFGDVRS